MRHADLGFMHQIGAKDGHIGLELGQDGFADAEGLNGFLIGAGKKMLVMGDGEAERLPDYLRESNVHGMEPLRCAPPQKVRGMCSKDGPSVRRCSMKGQCPCPA